MTLTARLDAIVRDCNLDLGTDAGLIEQIERHLKEAVAAEREACARVAEQHAPARHGIDLRANACACCVGIAARIRSRMTAPSTGGAGVRTCAPSATRAPTGRCAPRSTMRATGSACWRAS